MKCFLHDAERCFFCSEDGEGSAFKPKEMNANRVVYRGRDDWERKDWTPLRQRGVEALKRGDSVRDVAVALEVSESTVSQWAHRARERGILPPLPVTRSEPKRGERRKKRAQAEPLFRAGLRNAEVARALGVTPRAAQYWRAMRNVGAP